VHLVGVMSDDQLLPRAQHGDAEAVGALWRSHRRWVAAVLLAHRPQAVELEDLLQEVALVFVQKLHALREPERLLPWLASVARNVARTAARRRAGGLGQLASLPPAAEATLVDPAAADERRRHAVGEQLERVLAAAERLHEDYREPLLLRALQDLGQEQIAAILGLPVTTVETRLARARRMLRRELELAPARACVATSAPAIGRHTTPAWTTP